MNTERRYDIDWLRIILILSVFLYHIGMFFNGWGYHVKNNVQVDSLHPLMSFLHCWRMPLLFFISGVGTYFALGKRSIGSYVKERHIRLAIPLVLGMFILVAPQVYIERIDQYDSFFDFYPHFTDGVYPTGNFSWHHLWFICYLLLCSMLALPVFILMKSAKGKKIYAFLEKIFAKKGAFALLFIPLLISQILLKPYFPNETHALIDDWATFANSFIYFIYGFILLSSKKIVEQIFKQRHLHLAISAVATFMMFWGLDLVSVEYKQQVWDLSAMLMSWFLSLAIVGYAQKYLNFSNKFRKLANEAIYPFYLLHQPVLIILGYLMMNLEMNIWLKAVYLTLSTLLVIIAIYLPIRKINFLRFIFGMRILPKRDKSERKLLPMFLRARK